MPTPEQVVKNKVCKLLTEAGIFFFQVNNGAVYDKNIGTTGGYRSLSKWAIAGVSDLIAIVNGQFIGIELKKNEKDKASPDQILFAKRVERNKGQYYLIGSEEQAKAMLIKLGINSTWYYGLRKL